MLEDDPCLRGVDLANQLGGSRPRQLRPHWLFARLNQSIVEIYISAGQMRRAALRHFPCQIHKPRELEERVAGKCVSKFVRQPVQIVLKDAGRELKNAFRFGHMLPANSQSCFRYYLLFELADNSIPLLPAGHDSSAASENGPGCARRTSGSSPRSVLSKKASTYLRTMF